MQAENDRIQALLAAHPLQGVDYADGLKRFGDQATVYVRIIKSFIKNTPPSLEELGAVSTDTLNEYAVRVHGLKGSCYGISAMTLGDEAKALELASKAADWALVEQDNPVLLEHVRELIAQLSELVSIIEQAETSTADSRLTVDTPDRELLRRLLDAAQNYDVESLEQIVTEMARVRYRSDALLAERLRDYLTNFRYDLIEETVVGLLS